MENNYTVYMHIFPNGKKYIGITMQELNKRWLNGKGYLPNKYMSNAIKKYGWENIKHIILFDNLTRDEASNKEIELINYYDLTNPEKGYNLDKGGLKNKIVSNSTKEKLSKSHLGHKVLDETKEKISNSMKGKRNGGALKIKSVDVFDLNYNYLKTYDCMNIAAKELNVSVQSISLCCTGKAIRSKQYKFKYHE